jgi:DNA-binding NtrC family response regulator
MTVMINGESGVGKESFSKIIHQLSTRKHGQFIAINCGAIPEGTIDSELFGHEKGSFTGASDARKGYFEVTNGGTIFLDEIGEMPMGTQARLLRVLENGEFIRVGSSKVVKTDVRVVAATNVHLLDAVEKGKFREDLYYRLNTVPIFVPPLRDRDSDIELLFRKFTLDFSEKYRIKAILLDESAKKLLLQYRFPGNIRQLKNLAEQVTVLESGKEISAEILQKYLPVPRIISSGVALFNDSAREIAERDLLYKVIYDTRKEVADLKKIVLNLLQNNQFGNQIINNNQDIFNTENSENINSNDLVNTTSKHFLLPMKSSSPSKESDNEMISTEFYTDSSDESLSIEEKEKELIIKALKKNHQKRKLTAIDLGISERTLYRKIKQYGIEEN